MKSRGKDLKNDAQSNLSTSARKWLTAKDGFRSGDRWKYYSGFSFNIDINGLNVVGQKN